MSDPTIDLFGDQRWCNSKNQLHREDGPAYIGFDGYLSYRINGTRHREGGPAVIHADGSQEWWVNGELHRTDGPAFIDVDGTQEWYLHGKQITDVSDIKLLTGKEDDLIMLILKYGF